MPSVINASRGSILFALAIGTLCRPKCLLAGQLNHSFKKILAHFKNSNGGAISSSLKRQIISSYILMMPCHQIQVAGRHDSLETTI